MYETLVRIYYIFAMRTVQCLWLTYLGLRLRMRILFWIFAVCMWNIALLNLVISMELSNANTASTWMGERLTLQGTIDFSCIFVFFFLYLLFILIIMEKVKATIPNITCHKNGTCMK